MVIKYFNEVFRAYIYFRNPKGENITFYRVSDVAFVDIKRPDRAFKDIYLYYSGNLLIKKQLYNN
jgi:hypothetical protein